VISYSIESSAVKVKSLNDFNFLEKINELFQNINDIAQGEEIIELLNIYFRKLLEEVKLDIYKLEAAKKVKRADAVQEGLRGYLHGQAGHPGEDAHQVHRADPELAGRRLLLTQVYQSDLLECLLCSGMIIYSLEALREDILNVKVAQIVLNVFLNTNDDHLLSLVAHVFHLHCHFPSSLP
jgi:hypothetical protein